MKLNLSWTDSRIDFLHLRDDDFINSVNQELRSRLWIPEIGKFLAFFRYDYGNYLILVY